MTTLTEEQIEAIRARAKAATPGPWYHCQPFQMVPVQKTIHGPVPEQRVDYVSTWDGPGTPKGHSVVAHMDGRKEGLRSRDMAFIAAANPSVVLALLSALEAANKRAVRQIAAGVTDDQIDHMVDRFLNWKLPENFNPDGGISFQKTTNENTPWPHKSEPVGTNLFDAQQAKAMVLHMVEGLHCKHHNEPAADEARALSARLEAETKRADEAEAALERDRSIVAAHTTALFKAIEGRQGLLEGRGSYEWDDDRYRKEFGEALKEIEAPIERLRAIARDWTNCPTDPEKIKDARSSETELTALRARVAELEGALRPFADKAAKWEANHPIRVGSREHSHSTQVTHRLGDFRRARDVLEGADLKGASHEQG